MKSENPHKGHRERMKLRFRREGLNGFATHEILEMLLFYGVPMKDTNELAHELLNRFGGLARVLEAPYEELVQVKGVSDHVATLISFCSQLYHVYQEDRVAVGTLLYSAKDYGNFLVPKFAGLKRECVIMVCMDNRRKVLNTTVLFQGSVNSTEITSRQVLQQALRDNATLVVLAHNHPNGHAFPSEMDIQTTRMLVKALAVADIRLVDHLVISENDFVSMAETPALDFVFARDDKE